MKSSQIFCMILILFITAAFTAAQDADTLSADDALLNINNWQYWQNNKGQSFHLSADNYGGYFPDPQSGVIYTDGIIWGGYVNTNQGKELRVGGQTYESGTVPGVIGYDQDNADQKVYCYRADLSTIYPEQITKEAVDYFNLPERDITTTHEEKIYNYYVSNRNNWPAELGAPYYDRNRNGVFDKDYDEPGIVGADQMIWYAVNDMDDSTSRSLYGTQPIGLEVQTTVWAYKGSKGILGSTLFKRYRLINKSDFSIDSMFVGQFIDMDINYYGNDLGGCDSTLSFGYMYNDDPIDNGFENVAPAVGYVVLQGPITPAEGEQAIFNFKEIDNHRNLPMTSLIVKSTGAGWWDPIIGWHEGGGAQMYHLLNGNIPVSDPENVIPFRHNNKPNGAPTKYVCHGNPVTGDGDIDGTSNNFDPGDRRLYMSSGPFDMAPGETQEVVYAIVGGQGSDNIQSVAELYESVPVLHEFYHDLTEWEDPTGRAQQIEKVDHDLGINEFSLSPAYPNPFNSKVNFRFKLYGDMDMILQIFDLQGRKIKTVVRDFFREGDYEFSWNGVNESGQSMAAGIYLVTLKSGPKFQTRKIIYLK